MASIIPSGWHRIKPEDVVQAWPHILPLLQDAIDRDAVKRETADDIRALLESGARSLWIGWRDGLEAVMVLHIVDFAKLRTAWITHGAGNNLKHWLGPPFGVVFDYLRGYNCALIELAGRKGFARAAPREWKRGAYLKMEL